jgi:hypothetical protein
MGTGDRHTNAQQVQGKQQKSSKQLKPNARTHTG